MMLPYTVTLLNGRGGASRTQRIAGRGEAPRLGARRRFAPLGPGNPQQRGGQG